MTMNRPRCGKPLRKYSRPGQEPVPATERVCWIPEGHPPDTRCMSKEAYERHITQVAARNKGKRPRYHLLRDAGYSPRDAERLSATEASAQRAIAVAGTEQGGTR